MRKGRDGGKKQGGEQEMTDQNSGHYVIASSWPPERQPLERRMLAPKSLRSLIMIIEAFKEDNLSWKMTFYSFLPLMED